MGSFLERNSSRQGREGKMVFYFTGAEIPQRNIKSMIGNTGECFGNLLSLWCYCFHFLKAFVRCRRCGSSLITSAFPLQHAGLGGAMGLVRGQVLPRAGAGSPVLAAQAGARGWGFDLDRQRQEAAR